ncbi:hypothetical protein K432DRAFT_363822 [Lepidopterella palustris CBS 459.81]|uniref:ABM domain-containing protein n=1 Tax=Lepidopterella palustris CBS 459.81 TaxID=1314670 RepID=A0A8E2J9C8_9PEZI|nr:hypothetical protein K432DRAFT_363822 [Lepidopterella palustris CBS 459.81]
MVYTIVVHLYAKDDQTSISKLQHKLIEASTVYGKDRETVGWHVMQSVSDPRAFTIVERYERESSQKYHLENPYWKSFDPYVIPLLEKPMDLRRFNELDVNNAAAGDHVHDRADPSIGQMYEDA